MYSQRHVVKKVRNKIFQDIKCGKSMDWNLSSYETIGERHMKMGVYGQSQFSCGGASVI